MLTRLPEELATLVLARVGDLRDRASVCLAHPRLGLAAMHELDEWANGPLFAIAMYIWCTPSAVINEVLLRRYAADRRASTDGCTLLTAWADGEVGLSQDVIQKSHFVWCVQPSGAKVREEFPSGNVQHYEGERGAERIVRGEHPNGTVAHYKGEEGAERVVREVHPDGTIFHFKGALDAERWVRAVRPDGTVIHFKGERGAERLVRMVRPDGYVLHYKGEQYEERVVRVVRPDGTTVDPATESA